MFVDDCMVLRKARPTSDEKLLLFGIEKYANELRDNPDSRFSRRLKEMLRHVMEKDAAFLTSELLRTKRGKKPRMPKGQ